MTLERQSRTSLQSTQSKGTMAERSDAIGSPPERSDGGSFHQTSLTEGRPSEAYGEAIKSFAWSYKVDVLPVPSARTAPYTQKYGYGDRALKGFVERVLRDLETYQGHQIHYTYALETGRSGWRHVHLLLGSLSRLGPLELEGVFKQHGFGMINIAVWDRQKENGYLFKSLDRPSRCSDDICWDTNVTWNKACRNRMKLCRKHLDKLTAANSH